MKTTRQHFKAITVMAAVSGATLFGCLAQAATLNWTNTSGGFWSNKSNWSPHQIPTNSDNTLITAPGTYTVVFDLPSYTTVFALHPASGELMEQHTFSAAAPQ
jgi:hypothetical protein